MAEAVSKSHNIAARAAVLFVIAFVVGGLVWYGASSGVRHRIWENLLDRPSGPMAFRLVLQPAMASLVAIREGINDARTGSSPYLWTMLSNPTERGARLSEGIRATARIVLLGLAMDTIYQAVVLDTFYPGEAALVAIALCFVPYALIRGPASRAAKWWIAQSRSHPQFEQNLSSALNAGEMAHRFEAKVSAESHFSWLRTRLSVERTLMAWIRTAVSLIGFGFTIVQFFERFNGIAGVSPARHPEAARYFGLSLILCGVLATVIAIWEYAWTLRYLWSGGFAEVAGMKPSGKHTPVLAVAVLLCLVGIFAFISIVFRIV